MKNLLTRSVSGLIYAVVILFAAFLPPYGVIFLALLLGSAAIIEWLQLVEQKRLSLNASLILGIFLLLIYRFSDRFMLDHIQTLLGEVLIGLLMMSLSLSQVFGRKKKALSTLFHAYFGILYITLPLLCLTKISYIGNQEHSWLLAGLFLLIWSGDTFAYLIGKAIGKHKLLPTISPNKTWEGLAAGILATLLTGALIGYYLSPLPLHLWLGLALVVAVFGNVGDLFESAIKRHYGLKDSGIFLPGHGGILDRIDSLLFAVPMAYFYLMVYQHLAL